MASEKSLEILQLYQKEKSLWPVRELAKRAENTHEQLEFHAQGEWSERYIGIERPNEPDYCKEHRKTVWESPTKNYFEKVINALSKMRNAEDWQIKFNDDREYQKIFIEYCTKSFPKDDSVENFYFTIGLPKKLEDPNAVILVEPLKKENELKPYPFIYETEDVLFCVDNEYFVLLEDEIELEGGTGYVIKIVDRKEINTFVQVGKRSDFKFMIDEERSYIHNFGYCPAFKIGGVPDKTNRFERIYKSYLTPCMGSWNTACRRSSDLEVNFILHMNLERWEIQDSECKTCNGSGFEVKNIGTVRRNIDCRGCGGSGRQSAKGPYGTKYFKPATQVGTNTMVPGTFPPMGYIDRDTKVIELQSEHVDKKIFEGLSSISMEYVMEVPLATSGVSKAYDKQETNAFISRVLNDVVDNNLKPIYEFVARWMFGSNLTESELAETVPFINKAKKLDYINSDVLAARADQANKAGFSQSVTLPMQLSYAKIELGEDTNEYKRLKAIYDLDPFSTKTTDDKLAMGASGTVKREMLILSDNINYFVVRAENEVKDFYDMTYTAKMAVMNKYVAEVVGTTQTTPVE